MGVKALVLMEPGDHSGSAPCSLRRDESRHQVGDDWLLIAAWEERPFLDGLLYALKFQWVELAQMAGKGRHCGLVVVSALRSALSTRGNHSALSTGPFGMPVQNAGGLPAGPRLAGHFCRDQRTAEASGIGDGSLVALFAHDCHAMAGTHLVSLAAGTAAVRTVQKVWRRTDLGLGVTVAVEARLVHAHGTHLSNTVATREEEARHPFPWLVTDGIALALSFTGTLTIHQGISPLLLAALHERLNTSAEPSAQEVPDPLADNRRGVQNTSFAAEAWNGRLKSGWAHSAASSTMINVLALLAHLIIRSNAALRDALVPGGGETPS
mmetsp:Transcript_39690/g.86642  ORF Transcript_39690/g.86642 Transcript_39690/m.86642 type:complete len:324 (-) Transcript_39690:789-1760(-)